MADTGEWRGSARLAFSSRGSHTVAPPRWTGAASPVPGGPVGTLRCSAPVLRRRPRLPGVVPPRVWASHGDGNVAPEDQA